MSCSISCCTSSWNYSISITFDQGFDPLRVDEIVKMATGPVVGVVKEFLSQSGYTMNLFESLYADTTYLDRLEYSVLVPIKKKVNIKSLMGCLSSVFSVVRADVAKGAVMRYKRVSNYNEMDSSEAYVVEMINAGSRDTEIIQGLMSNFQLSVEEARERLGSFVSRLQLVQDAFQGSERLRVKNNPGFLTTMSLEDHNAALRITVSDVNDVGYLRTIPVYIDALVRMTQTPWASRVDKKSITALCKKQQLVDAAEKKEIVAPAELPQGQQKAMDIVAEELIQKLGLNIHVYNPVMSPSRREAVYGANFCVPDNPQFEDFKYQVKLEPFQRALEDLQPEIWISGIRKEETKFRQKLGIVAMDTRGILKVSPLFNWTEDDISEYMMKYSLPNCRHYFDPTKVDSQTECGLHLSQFEQGGGI